MRYQPEGAVPEFYVKYCIFGRIGCAWVYPKVYLVLFKHIKWYPYINKQFLAYKCQLKLTIASIFFCHCLPHFHVKKSQISKHCQGHFLHNYTIFKLINFWYCRGIRPLSAHEKWASMLNFKVLFWSIFIWCHFVSCTIVTCEKGPNMFLCILCTEIA